MNKSRKLEPETAALLAQKAFVDARTLHKWLLGFYVRPLVNARLELAAKELGLNLERGAT
jgi:hypothetical protein